MIAFENVGKHSYFVLQAVPIRITVGQKLPEWPISHAVDGSAEPPPVSSTTEGLQRRPSSNSNRKVPFSSEKLRSSWLSAQVYVAC